MPKYINPETILLESFLGFIFKQFSQVLVLGFLNYHAYDSGSLCVVQGTGKEVGFANAMPNREPAHTNVILWCILTEVFHGIDDLGTILHLIHSR